jgi:hypothetical protein
MGPAFAQHYTYRSTGPLPFCGGTEAVTEGWVEERDAGPLDPPAIMGLLDAWWPTIFSVEPAPRAVATVEFTMELLSDPTTLPRGEPLFYRGNGVASRDGFFLETRELWSGDRVVAMNQQSFAILS